MELTNKPALPPVPPPPHYGACLRFYTVCARVGFVSPFVRVASHVKDAIKAYEQSTSLPYDDVPPELCLAREGTRSVDLSGWSLLVNDTALRCIAAEDQKRIDGLARQSGVSKVPSASFFCLTKIKYFKYVSFESNNLSRPTLGMHAADSKKFPQLLT